ncbi:NADH:ubiquinone reductase (Na(+)-transporting) subunit C [Vibrio harveyi]|uniref:NADH:ubiquinone reductase (Na(+)-transporting) subunit C n=1 Tax=Vibrio harveyi TaxID=669 RepID=UPI000C79EA11|nr:NADH:ubiquinone reductase (Na(+)-transporting) subunit C [Vibrio harveyi]
MKVRIGLALVAAALFSLSGCSEPEQAKKEPPKLTQLDQRLTLAESAGLMDKRMPMKKLMEQYVSVEAVDLDSGEYRDASMSVDESFSAFPIDPSNVVKLSSRDDLAGIKMRENRLPVYLIKDDNGQVSRIVLPIRGEGKFGLIYGYLALYSDNYHIASLSFYKHGESAGLGAEITDNANWTKQFKDKPLFDHGHPSIRIVQEGRNTQDAYSVDGISGATYTSQGVEHAINFWTGDLGFGEFLRQYRN